MGYTLEKILAYTPVLTVIFCSKPITKPDAQFQAHVDQPFILGKALEAADGTINCCEIIVRKSGNHSRSVVVVQNRVRGFSSFVDVLKQTEVNMPLFVLKFP